MRVQTAQKGFSAVEALIVVVIIGIIGVAGYGVWRHNRDIATKNGTTTPSTATTTTPANTQSPTATNVATAPSSVNSTSDLDRAAQTLDQTDPNSSNTSDSSQLDAQLANL